MRLSRRTTKKRSTGRIIVRGLHLIELFLYFVSSKMPKKRTVISYFGWRHSECTVMFQSFFQRHTNFWLTYHIFLTYWMILSDLRCAVFHLHSRTKSQIDHSWYLVCTQFQTRVIWVDWQELGFPMAIRYVLEFCPPLHLCYPVDYKPSLHRYQITRLLYWLLNQFRLYSSSHSSSDWLLWQRVPGTLRGNDNKSRIISIIQHY